jgi:hypothetical protein
VNADFVRDWGKERVLARRGKITGLAKEVRSYR